VFPPQPGHFPSVESQEWKRSGIMKSMRKILSGLAVATLAITMAACAGGGGRYNDMPTHRYYDTNPNAFDSDVYYDPTYNLRGDGEFRPRYKLEPYN
jgi:hypothetical protein